MIWESSYWKSDLLAKAKKLRGRKSQRRWPETSLAKLEQELMLGFYSIRKLHEAMKLSNKTVEQVFHLSAFPATGKPIHKLNWHNYWELFDLDSVTTEEHDALFLCHQFIHSYIFIPAFDDDDGLEGILFASDRQRRKSLLMVTIDQVISLFEAVGADYPSHVIRRFNHDKGDFEAIDIDDCSCQEHLSTYVGANDD